MRVRSSYASRRWASWCSTPGREPRCRSTVRREGSSMPCESLPSRRNSSWGWSRSGGAGETVWAELGRRILAGGPAFTTALGLGGVQLVTSDRLSGAEDAIATVFPGASWQRCRTHFLTNPLSKVPPPLTASSCRRHRRSAPHGDLNDAARRGSLINQRGWRSYTT